MRTSASPLFLLWFFTLLLHGTSSHAEPTLTLLPANQIPPLVDDLDRSSLKAVLQHSLTALEHKPGSQAFSFGQKRVSVARLRDSLDAFLALLDQPGDLAMGVRREFDLYRATEPVLFTGYHEPELRGSFLRTERYRYPLYRRPTDLVEVDTSQFAPRPFEEKVYGRVANGKLVPYFSRAQIDGRHILAQQHKEIVWLDDPVERFFLHIQGSGKSVFRTAPGFGSAMQPRTDGRTRASVNCSSVKASSSPERHRPKPSVAICSDIQPNKI